MCIRDSICSRVEIERGVPPADTEGYDLIGFGYPIYGFNSPLPFNRYVNTLEIERGQKFFIYKNSGETFAMNNASSRILLRRMKRRGEMCIRDRRMAGQSQKAGAPLSATVFSLRARDFVRLPRSRLPLPRKAEKSRYPRRAVPQDL